MNKLLLDLETLEVERLDVTVTGLKGGLETFGMGHASTELGQSCTGGGCDGDTCACSEEQGEATSCIASECECNEEYCDG